MAQNADLFVSSRITQKSTRSIGCLMVEQKVDILETLSMSIIRLGSLQYASFSLAFQQQIFIRKVQT